MIPVKGCPSTKSSLYIYENIKRKYSKSVHKINIAVIQHKIPKTNETAFFTAICGLIHASVSNKAFLNWRRVV